MPSGTYKAGDDIDIRITFTRPNPPALDLIHRTSGPAASDFYAPLNHTYLELNIPGRSAEFLNKTSGSILFYRYTVQDGDVSEDLGYANRFALHAPQLRSGADDRTVNCNLPNPGAAGSLRYVSDVVVDGKRPAVESVTSPNASSAYAAGSYINVTVSFDEDIYVTGTPLLELGTGAAGGRNATYVSGNGSSVLAFNYTVRPGDLNDDLGYTGVDALSRDGGAIVDLAGNNANLTLPSPGENYSLSHSKDIQIDTKRPTVASVSSATPSGTYGVGSPIDMRVTFDEDVDVDESGGRPSIALATGAAAGRHAEYDAAASTARTLAFSYTVTAGDNTADLDYDATAVILPNGGIIRDVAGNNATLTLPPPGTDGLLGPSGTIRLDAVWPTVESVSSATPNGTYGIGSPIDVRVTFSKDVVVDETGGTPSIALATGAAAGRYAAYDAAASTTPRTLVFSYAVTEGDDTADLDYTNATALSAGGGTVRGTDGVDANLTLPGPGAPGSLGHSSDIKADGVPPRLLGVSSPDPDGTYGTGRIINVTVSFDEPVYVSGGSGGTPALALATTPPRNASYAGGSGTAEMSFLYAVRPGDEAARLDYSGTGSLSMEGWSLVDGLGNAAKGSIPLPPPGEPGSLGASGSIAIAGWPLPILRPAGAAIDDHRASGSAYTAMRGASDVDAFEMDGGMYALVSGRLDNAVQLVRIHDNGTLSAGGTVGGAGLDTPLNVVAFEMNGSTRAIVSGTNINLLSVHPDGTLSRNDTAGNMESSPGGVFDKLGNAKASSVFEAAGGTYAIVASNIPLTTEDDGLQLVRILPNGTLSRNGSASNGNGFLLGGVGAVDMLGPGDGDGDAASIGDPPRALVASQDDNAVQLVSVHPNGTLSVNGSATNGTRGFDALAGALAVDVFGTGGNGNGRTHAVVISPGNNAIQLARILPNGTLVAAGSASNGTGGFDALALPQDVAAFEMGGWPYALVSSYTSDGIQLIRIDAGDGALVAAGSAKDDEETVGFDTLANPGGVAVFDAGGRKYALVASGADHGVQLVRLSPTSVANVSASACGGSGGPHAAGKTINITVAFDGPVVLQDPQRPPSLLLSIDGADDRAAPYLDGNGTAGLIFNYTVRPGDSTPPGGPYLEYAHAGALLSRGAITDLRGDPADLELPAPGTDGSLGRESRIAIDAAPPYAVSVSSPNASGTYAQGDVVHITVAFSENVSVTGTPMLGLALDGESRNALYSYGADTDMLTFVYTVQPGDEAADLAHAGALSLAGGSSSIRDAVGHAAIEALPTAGRVLPPGGSGAIAIDGVGPSVASVTEAEPDKGAPYMQGETIKIAVDFGETVAPSGDFNSSLRLALDAGGDDAAAWYEGPSDDRRALVYSYTVQDGDAADPLDYAGGQDALTIASGNVTDALGNPTAAGALPLPDPGGDGSLAASGIRIDTGRPSVLSAAPTNASGTYGLGADIGIAVSFNEAVYVAGSPLIGLNTGGEAVYASGSGNTTLVFVYTILLGDQTPVLEYAGAGALGLHGGSIRDEAGNDANTTLPVPGAPGSLGGSGTIIAINATAPPPPGVPTSIVSVLSPDGSGPHGGGSAVNITVEFNRPVRAEGNLALALSTDPPRSAVHAAAGGSAAAAAELLFLYAVQPGDFADRLDYADTGALTTSSGGSVLDTAGNNADLTLPEPGSQHSLYAYNIGIDGVAPAARSVDSPTANDTYGIGSTIVIHVLFDEAVHVTGSPLIGLNTGGEAVYASGNGTATLAFEYTVLAGDQTDDLDYTGAGALNLNGGTIRDAAGNNANQMLPAPGEAGSLGASADIVVDATAPPPPGEAARVLRVSSPDVGGKYGAGTAVNITVDFNRPVRVEGDLALALSTVPPRSAVRAADNGGAAAVAATSHEVALVYAVQPGDSADRLDYAGTGALTVSSSGGSVRDAAGSSANLTLPEPGSSQSLSGSGIAIGAAGSGGRDPSPAPDAPAVVSVHVRVPAAPYTAGQTIAIDVVFSAPVAVGAPGGAAAGAAGAGAPYLKLLTGSAGARAEYVSGSGTDTIRFEYTVRGGDIVDRLSYAGAGALRLGGGAISAAAGSGLAASVALPEPGAPGSLTAPGSPAARIDPEPGRPVLDVGILDDDDEMGGGVREAALAAAYAFNEEQGRSPDALLLNATAYGVGATTGSAAAEALRAAHAGGGTGPSMYVGPSTDRGLHAAMPYAAANGIVLISAGSTAPSLAVEDDTVFRFLPGGRLDAEALARLARAADAQSMVAVLENVTHGPPTAAGADLTDATPPSQDRFSRAFDAALDYAGVPTLSGTITLEGGAAAGGGPYEAAAAAEALDAAVVQAARSSRVAVVYAGSHDGLAALAAEASASYPALASATWIASGQSAGSSLLAGDGTAAAFAAQAGLQAARWSVPANDLARAVDSLVQLPPGADAGARHRAYAAYDAMGVIGAAAAAAAAETRGDVPDAAAVAELVPGTAAAYDGALGDIALNSAGDLWVPAVYDLWAVGAAQPGGGGAGTVAEWTLQEGALDETRACSIALTRAKIDYGPIDSGQTSRPHLQTIVNTGQLPFSRVDLTATPWHVDSPGSCEAGDMPSLPVGLSEIRTVQGGAFSDLAASGTVLAEGLKAGGQAPLWYRLSLAGYADLPQAEITQCATYVVRCG